MCVRVVEPVALVFGKLLSTNHGMLQNVQFGFNVVGSQGDRFGCTASAHLCVGTDIVELGL